MTDDQLAEELAKSHIAALADEGHGDYDVFELIDALDPAASRTQAIRQAVAAVVEINVAERLRRGRSIAHAAKSLLARDADSAELFQTWSAWLERAKPHRGAMKAVCADFIELVDALSPAIAIERRDFIGELLSHHGLDGVEMIRSPLARLLQGLSPDQRDAFVEFMSPYLAEIYSEPLAGMFRMVAALVKADAGDLLKSFKDKCPPTIGEDDSHSEPFFTKCGGAVEGLAQEHVLVFLRLAIRAASQSFSSAAAVSAKLPKRLAALAPDARGGYLEAVARIVDAVGIRSVSFCLGPLHRIYCPSPVRGAAEFVDAACEVARRYGPTAAAAFIGRKTKASRQAWPTAR